MSPGWASGTLSRLPGVNRYSWPMRSDFSLVAFHTGESEVSLPDTTRTIAILPTSEGTILNT